MKALVLNLPTLGFIVVTRAMLGVGVGLLLSERIPAEKRRAVAVTLLAVGAATTVPAVMAVLGGRRSANLQAA